MSELDNPERKTPKERRNHMAHHLAGLQHDI